MVVGVGIIALGTGVTLLSFPLIYQPAQTVGQSPYAATVHGYSPLGYIPATISWTANEGWASFQFQTCSSATASGGCFGSSTTMLFNGSGGTFSFPAPVGGAIVITMESGGSITFTAKLAETSIGFDVLIAGSVLLIAGVALVARKRRRPTVPPSPVAPLPPSA